MIRKTRSQQIKDSNQTALFKLSALSIPVTTFEGMSEWRYSDLDDKECIDSIRACLAKGGQAFYDKEEMRIILFYKEQA